MRTMHTVTVGGIKVKPTWEWSPSYKAHVQGHARDLRSLPFPSDKLTRTPHMGIVAQATGKPFRTIAEQDLAHSMARYALWMLDREGVQVTTYCVVVDLHHGAVRFTVHPDLHGTMVLIPNHAWKPTVLDDTHHDEPCHAQRNTQHNAQCNELITA
jgi:hypothetical protein